MATPKKSKPRTEATAEKLFFVRNLVNQRTPRGQIKKRFAEEFKCSPRSAEPFITKAIADIRAEMGKSLDEHKGDSYAFWDAIVSDTTRTDVVRMRAQENLDRLTGVAAPIKVAPTDSAGKDLPPQASRKRTLKELNADLDKLLEETTGAE